MVQVNLSHCKRMTCTGGGNIFNYLHGTSEIRRCQGNNYMLSAACGGWNIYILDVPRLSKTENVDRISFTFAIVCVWMSVIILVGTMFVLRKRNHQRYVRRDTVPFTDATKVVSIPVERSTDAPHTYYMLKPWDQPPVYVSMDELTCEHIRLKSEWNCTSPYMI